MTLSRRAFLVIVVAALHARPAWAARSGITVYRDPG
jgi:hypothetical protein